MISQLNNAFRATPVLQNPGLQPSLQVATPGGFTADAIRANLATPVATSSAIPVEQARAALMAHAMQSRKYLGQVMSLALAHKLNLGTTLEFAQRNLAKIDAALTGSSSAEEMINLLKQSQQDWQTKGPRMFDRARHGIYRNAGRDLINLAQAFRSLGAGPDTIKAFREGVATLRKMEAAGLPKRGSPQEFNDALNGITARILDALKVEVNKHPEMMEAAGTLFGVLRNTTGMLTIGLVTAGRLESDLDKLFGPRPPSRPGAGTVQPDSAA